MNFDGAVGFLKGRLFLVLLIGVAIRVSMGLVFNYNFDVSSWSLVMSNTLAGNGLYEVDGYFYTPVWGYFLGFLSGSQDLLLNVSSFGEFYPGASLTEHVNSFGNAYITNSAFNIMVKSMIFVFDLLAAYLIYWIIDDVTGDRKKAETACIVWFLCPAVFLVSAVNGMFDVLMAVFILLQIILVRRDRLFLAGFFLALSVTLKLFPAFFVFPFIAYVWSRHRASGDQVRSLLTGALGMAVAFAAALAPFIAMGQFGDCIGFITNRFGDGGLGSGLPAFVGYLVVVAYALVLQAVVFFSYRAMHGEAVISDRGFLMLCSLTACIILLFPSNQQYYLLLIPFLVISYILGVGNLRKSIAVISVGSFISLFSGLTLLVLGFIQTFGLGDIDEIVPGLGWLIGGDVPLCSMIAYVGLVLLWIGGAHAAYTMLRQGVENGDLDCVPGKLADAVTR